VSGAPMRREGESLDWARSDITGPRALHAALSLPEQVAAANGPRRRRRTTGGRGRRGAWRDPTHAGGRGNPDPPGGAGGRIGLGQLPGPARDRAGCRSAVHAVAPFRRSRAGVRTFGHHPSLNSRGNLEPSKRPAGRRRRCGLERSRVRLHGSRGGYRSFVGKTALCGEIGPVGRARITSRYTLSGSV